MLNQSNKLEKCRLAQRPIQLTNYMNVPDQDISLTELTSYSEDGLNK